MSTPNAEENYNKLYQEAYDELGPEYTDPSSMHYDPDWADMLARRLAEDRINEGDYDQTGGED